MIFGIVIAIVIAVVLVIETGERMLKRSAKAQALAQGQGQLSGSGKLAVIRDKETGDVYTMPLEEYEAAVQDAQVFIADQYRNKLAADYEVEPEEVSMQHVFKKFAEGVDGKDAASMAYLIDQLTAGKVVGS